MSHPQHYAVRSLAKATVKSLRADGVVADATPSRAWAADLEAAEYDHEMLPDLMWMLDDAHTSYEFAPEKVKELPGYSALISSSRSDYRKWLERVVAGKISPQVHKVAELACILKVSPCKVIDVLPPVRFRVRRVEGGVRMAWQAPSLVRETDDPKTPLALARRVLGVPSDLIILASGYNDDRGFYSGVENGRRPIRPERLRRIEKLLELAACTLDDMESTRTACEAKLAENDQWVSVTLPDDLDIEVTFSSLGVAFERAPDRGRP